MSEEEEMHDAKRQRVDRSATVPISSTYTPHTHTEANDNDNIVNESHVDLPVKRRAGLKIAWTREEDELLTKIVESYAGQRIPWQTIATSFPTRNSKRCRERWVEYLDPHLNTTPFSPEEDALMLSHQSVIGNRWKAIAAKMRQYRRSSLAIRARCNLLNRTETRRQERLANLTRQPPGPLDSGTSHQCTSLPRATPVASYMGQHSIETDQSFLVNFLYSQAYYQYPQEHPPEAYQYPQHPPETYQYPQEHPPEAYQYPQGHPPATYQYPQGHPPESYQYLQGQPPLYNPFYPASSFIPPYSPQYTEYPPDHSYGPYNPIYDYEQYSPDYAYDPHDMHPPYNK